MNDKLEMLRIIAGSKTMTSEYKKFIRELSDELEVPFNGSTKCKQCYQDQATILYRKLKEMENVVPATRYTLKQGIDVTWCGKFRVCEATFTDEMAEQIIAEGFPKKWIHEN